MGTLRCDHPDIEAFIEAKRRPGILSHFNLSVLVTDAFMRAVEAGEGWPLVFPDPEHGRWPGLPHVERNWPGYVQPVACAVLGEIPASLLWQRLLEASHESSEPGVLFIDRINAENNLAAIEQISATNPCGEVPLPPHGACCLGSFNLTRFVEAPFSDSARLDLEAMAAQVPVAVRLLDNVIDLSPYPLPAQQATAQATRRLGLGITGLADALIMLNIGYDSPTARRLAGRVMQILRDAAYQASVALAREKGPFSRCAEARLPERPFVRRLPRELREAIARYGLRNSHLLAIAPAGSISLLAGNISSGIEPVYAVDAERRVRDRRGDPVRWRVVDAAVKAWRTMTGDAQGLPPACMTATEIAPEAHIAMQASLQVFVDNAISKTVNVPTDIDFETYGAIYVAAYRAGAKGCTTYRPGGSRDAILSREDTCCALPRASPG
jgi:ribonucleoside-diphosphate reductase alpha chain